MTEKIDNVDYNYPKCGCRLEFFGVDEEFMLVCSNNDCDYIGLENRYDEK